MSEFAFVPPPAEDTSSILPDTAPPPGDGFEPVPPPPEMVPSHETVDHAQRGAQVEWQLRNATRAPEEQAQILDLAAKTSWPLDVVAADIPKARAAAGDPGIDFVSLSREAPELSAYAQDPSRAPLVQGDVGVLSQLEAFFRGRRLPDEPLTTSEMEQGITEPYVRHGDSLGWKAVMLGLAERELAAAQEEKFYGPLLEDPDGRLGKMVGQGMASLGMPKRTPDERIELAKAHIEAVKKQAGWDALPTLSSILAGSTKLAVTMGPELAMAGAIGGAATAAGGAKAAFAASTAYWAHSTAPSTYANLKEVKTTDGTQVFSDDQARVVAYGLAVPVGMLYSGLGESVAGRMKPVAGWLGDKVGVTAATDYLARAAAGRALASPTVQKLAAAESMQFAKVLAEASVQYGVHSVSGAATLATATALEKTTELVARAAKGDTEVSSHEVWQTWSQSFQQGLKDFILIGAVGPMREAMAGIGRANASIESARQLADVANGTKKSKLAQRAPDEFAQLVERFQSDKQVAFTLDRWDSYAQEQHLDPRALAAEVLGDEGKAYDTAKAEGKTELVVPLHRYSSKMVLQGHADALALDRRLGLETDTPRTLIEAQQRTEKEARERENSPAFQAEVDDIYRLAVENLVKSGQDKALAEANARFIADSAKVTALKFKESVIDAVKRHRWNELSVNGINVLTGEEKSAAFTGLRSELDQPLAGMTRERWAERVLETRFDAYVSERAEAEGKSVYPEDSNAITNDDRAKWWGEFERKVMETVPDLMEGHYGNLHPEDMVYFASGSNHPGEIRGLRDAGLNVGVAVHELHADAPAALAELEGQPYNVFVDSGAFSEVSFGPKGPEVVKPITDAEWKRRLGVYHDIAKALRSQAYLVAPDKVGFQADTLTRLKTYRDDMIRLLREGANIIVPVQKGELSMAEMFRRQLDILRGAPGDYGVNHDFHEYDLANRVIAGIPSKKDATSTADLRAFVAEVKPMAVHLLGLGPESPGYAERIAAVKEASPGTQVYGDSVLLRRLVGKTNGPRGGPRLLTEMRDRLIGAGMDPGDAASLKEVTIRSALLDRSAGVTSTTTWEAYKKLGYDKATIEQANERRARVKEALKEEGQHDPHAEVSVPADLSQLQNLPAWLSTREAWMRSQRDETGAPRWTEEHIQRQLAADRGGLRLLKAVGLDRSGLTDALAMADAAIGMGLPKGAGLNPDARLGGPIRSNSDDIYVYSVDFSAECVKRLGLAATSRYIAQTTGRAPSSSEVMALTALYREAGLIAPCTICYVEAKRIKINDALNTSQELVYNPDLPIPPKWAESTKALVEDARAEVKALKLDRNAIDLSGYTDTAVQMSPEWKAQVEASPALHALYDKQAHNTKANQAKPYEEYEAQVLGLTPAEVATLNKFAGLRMQSSSDFQPEHTIDAIQVHGDADLKELCAHSYTKVTDFPLIFGDTGNKINLSIFAEMPGRIVEDGKTVRVLKGSGNSATEEVLAEFAGRGALAKAEDFLDNHTPEGGFAADNAEGMNWKDARDLTDRYKHAGPIIVATSSAMIRWAKAQPWIHQVIPYHASGLEKKFSRPLGWSDYSSTQHEEFLKDHVFETTEVDGGYRVTKDGVEVGVFKTKKEATKATKAPQIRMWELGMQDGVQGPAAEKKVIEHYLDLCAERGVRPVFEEFLTTDGKPLAADRSNIDPGYLKLKKDYARTDSPFRPVDSSKINYDHANRVLSEYLTSAADKTPPDVDMANKLLILRKWQAEHPDKDIGTEAITHQQARSSIMEGVVSGKVVVGSRPPKRRAEPAPVVGTLLASIGRAEVRTDLGQAARVDGKRPEGKLQRADAFGKSEAERVAMKTSVDWPHTEVTRWFEKEMNPKTAGTVLDYGAGKGAVAKERMLKAGYRVSAYDLWATNDPEVAALGKHVLKVEPGTVDNLLASNVINVQNDHASMLKMMEEWKSFLAPGGKVWLNLTKTPRKGWYGEWRKGEKEFSPDERRAQADKLELYLKQHFGKVERMGSSADPRFRLSDPKPTDLAFELAEAKKRAMFDAVRKSLTPDLLKADRRAKYDEQGDYAGHCQVATNALFHLLGGKASGWTEMMIPRKVLGSDTHYFLKNEKTGEILDPTAEQFGGGAIPYDKAQRAGSQQWGDARGKPTLRAQEVIRRVEARMAELAKESTPAERSFKQDGTTYARSKLGVGKPMGGDVYLHRQYESSLPDQKGLAEARALLPKGFDYNAVAARKGGAYTFFRSPDFDTAHEPTAGDYYTVKDGVAKKGKTDSIWHHKWMWVKDDYKGFNIDESYRRSKAIASLDIDTRNIGRPDNWRAITEGPAFRAALKAGEGAVTELDQNAYHGTRRRGIERFDSRFIGTGQGAASYGWGHYSGEMLDTAETYRRELSGQEVGQVYKVNVPEKDQLFSWDHRLSDQPPDVKAKLMEAAKGDGAGSAFLREAVSDDLSGDTIYVVLGQRLWTEAWESGKPGLSLDTRQKRIDSYRMASLWMKDHGIEGLKFYDSNSRGYKDEAKRTHNFVIWSDEAIRIDAELYQRQQADARRGSIQFVVDPNGHPRNFDIRTLGGDKSTLAHELAHFLSWSMHDVAASTDAPMDVRADYEKVLKFMGYESPEHRLQANIERAELGAATERTLADEEHLRSLHAKEERFSHAWEQYLLEGKAPAAELASTFGRFRRWLTKVYNGILGIKEQYRAHYGQELELSDEVRGVFNRILAVDGAIEAMRQTDRSLGFADLLRLTSEQRTQLAKLNEKKYEDARWALDVAVASGDQPTDAMLRERDRLTKDVTQEVESSNSVYQAQKLIRQGVLDEAGAGDFFGLGSAADVRHAIRTAKPLAKVVDEEVSRRMTEAFGPKLSENADALRALGMDALRNPAEIDEALAIHDAIVRELGPAAAGRQLNRTEEVRAARRAVMADTVENLSRLDDGRSTEEKAYAVMKEARAASDAGNKEKSDPLYRQALDLHDGALRAKLKARIAKDVVKQLDAARSKLESAGSEAAAVQAGKVDGTLAYQEGLLAIVQGAGVQKGQPGADAISTLLAKMQQDGGAVAVDTDGKLQAALWDSDAVAELAAHPARWETLTAAEAFNARDAAENVRKMVANLGKVQLANRKVERAQFIAELEKSSRYLGTAKGVDRAPGAVGSVQRLGRKTLEILQTIDANLMDVEALADRLSHGDRTSGIWQLLVGDRLKARDHERDLLAQYQGKLEKAFEGIRKLKLDEVIPGAKLDFPLPDTKGQLNPDSEVTRDYLLSIALNLGNDGNLQRLRDGYGWADPQRRLEKYLTKAEWQAVQDVWDALSGLFADIEKVEIADHGVRPGEVEATPFTVRLADGSTMRMAGGYYPARYDRRVKSTKLPGGGSVDTVAGVLGDSVPRRPKTATTHSQERAEKYDGLLDLQLGVLPDHVRQVIHDVSHRPYVKNAANVFLDPDFQALVKARMGTPYQEILVPWLTALAGERVNSDSMNKVTQALNWSKNRVSVAAVGFNAGVALADLANPMAPVMAGAISARHLAQVTAKLGTNWKELRAFALENSPELRQRAAHGNSQGLDIESITAQGMQARRKFDHAAFAMMEMTDRMTSTPVWLAKFYELAPKVGEAQAVVEADAVVRKFFPAADNGSRAMWLRNNGNFLSQLSFLYGFANKVYNVNRAAIAELGDSFRDPEETARGKAGAVARAVATIIGTGLVFGSAGAVLSGHGPKKDDIEGPGDLAVWALHEATWKHLLYGLPIVGQTLVMNRPATSPALRWLETTGRVLNEKDTPVWQKALEIGFNVGVDLVPGSGQARKTGRYLLGDNFASDNWPTRASGAAFGTKGSQAVTPFNPGGQ